MKKGEIVLVKFPFSDLETSKKRPALVLARTDLNSKIKLSTLAMITSKIDGLKLPGDHLVKNWEKAQLLHPSLVRLSKIATVEDDLIVSVLGYLGTDDCKGIQLAFQRQFKAWL